MLTIQGLKTLLQNKQQNHAQLSSGTFYFGDPWEFGANETIRYPFFGARLLPSGNNLTGNNDTTSIEIFFCDLVHKDESNETQVLSDMKQVALDIYSQVRIDLQDSYKANLNTTAQLSPFTERFDDEVSGWSIILNIEQFYDRSTCDTPDSGANAGKVIIYDADGNIVAILNPNSIYILDEVAQKYVENTTGAGSTMVFDNGTPSFVYGVFIEGQYAEVSATGRVLSIVGDTITFDQDYTGYKITKVYEI